MDRLSSMDSVFLDIEQSGPPVAVGSAMLVSGKAPTLAQVRTFIASRLDSMPRFRQRVVSSRTKVRQAKWVEVTPDLTYHVREVKLKPGDKIDGVVAAAMERELDRQQPLWDATLVTGYSTTEWCFIVRLHHSIADGQGAVILLGQLIDLDPDGNVRLADGITAMAAPRERHVEMAPESKLEEITGKTIKAIEKGMEGLGQFISTYPDTVRSVLALAPRQPTGITGPVSADRVWVGRRYSLTDVKTAKRSFKGVTINDIVLASVAYGFTKLLESRGENVDGRTLRAVMPISLRRNMDTNNQVSILPAPLPLGNMDPMKRIRMIKESTKHSKRSTLPIITDTLMRMTEKVTPAPLQEYVVSKSGIATQYFSETLVTNVPGPMIPLYFMGRPAIGSMPIIPIEGSMRIIVGITSFMDDLNMGITGDGQNASDVDVLAAGIAEGLDQICAVAEQRRAHAGEKEIAAAQAAAKKRIAKTRRGSAIKKTSKRRRAASATVAASKVAATTVSNAAGKKPAESPVKASERKTTKAPAKTATKKTVAKKAPAKKAAKKAPAKAASN